jgi:hypothetical protein
LALKKSALPRGNMSFSFWLSMLLVLGFPGYDLV